MTREDTRRHDKAGEGTARHEKAREGTRRHGKAREGTGTRAQGTRARNVSYSVESTSSCPIVGVYPEYLELSRGPPSVRSISVSQEHEQLSKVPPVVQSDFCQTGSVIHKYQRFSAALVTVVGSLVVRALDQ